MMKVTFLDEGADGIPVHQVRPDLLRLGVVGPKGDVEVLLVERDEGLRLDGRLDGVTGLVLPSDGHHEGVLPRLLVQHGVDLDRRGRPLHPELELRGRVLLRPGQASRELHPTEDEQAGENGR